MYVAAIGGAGVLLVRTWDDQKSSEVRVPPSVANVCDLCYCCGNLLDSISTYFHFSVTRHFTVPRSSSLLVIIFIYTTLSNYCI